VLANLAGLCVWQGRTQEALEYARAANSLAQELGAQRDRINALEMLGAACLALGDAERALAAHREEEELARQEGQENYAISAIAHQAKALLALGELPQALALIEGVLERLPQLSPNSTYSPTDVFYACSQVLAAAGDARLDGVLDQAHAYLQGHLERLEAPEHRRAFIENVPARAALMQAWESRRERVRG
jgi:ATP/maltotriose-dependent transcriptional regulator MalT